jgi:hypothetical protein
MFKCGYVVFGHYIFQISKVERALKDSQQSRTMRYLRLGAWDQTWEPGISDASRGMLGGYPEI